MPNILMHGKWNVGSSGIGHLNLTQVISGAFQTISGSQVAQGRITGTTVVDECCPVVVNQMFVVSGKSVKSSIETPDGTVVMVEVIFPLMLSGVVLVENSEPKPIVLTGTGVFVVTTLPPDKVFVVGRSLTISVTGKVFCVVTIDPPGRVVRKVLLISVVITDSPEGSVLEVRDGFTEASVVVVAPFGRVVVTRIKPELGLGAGGAPTGRSGWTGPTPSGQTLLYKN
jgi:hypothetical protein